MKTFTDLIRKYTQKLRKPCRSRALLWSNKDIHQQMKNRDLALKQSLVTRNNLDTLIFKGLRNKVTNLRIARKTTFGQSSFVAIGTKLWNTLPSEIKTLTELKVFNTQVKQWLKLNNPCDH